MGLVDCLGRKSSKIFEFCHIDGSLSYSRRDLLKFNISFGFDFFICLLITYFAINRYLTDGGTICLVK